MVMSGRAASGRPGAMDRKTMVGGVLKRSSEALGVTPEWYLRGLRVCRQVDRPTSSADRSLRSDREDVHKTLASAFIP